MFFVIGFMIGPLLGTALLEGLDVTYRVLFQIAAFILAAAIITSVVASRKSEQSDCTVPQVKGCNNYFSCSLKKKSKKTSREIFIFIN